MTLPSDARVLFHDDALVLAVWSNLVITDMRGGVRREHIPEIVKGYRSMQKLYPEGLVALTLIPHGLPVADSERRGEASKMLETFAGVIRQISIVLEGTGIWAGTMRTVLRGMTIVARNPCGMKVHEDVTAAARSLAPQIDEKPSEREVIDMVQRFRRATATPQSGAQPRPLA